MKQKLRRVLLIDDSAADNYYHKRILRKADVVEEVIIKENGKEALEYLKTVMSNDRFPQPELVFLDINMPVMNGWEFLDAYEKLQLNQKADLVVSMLTTSASPRDRERAKEYDCLMGYEEKPLTVEKVIELVRMFFPDRF